LKRGEETSRELTRPPALEPQPHPQQVFYHLGELDSALTYALGAGDLFDVDDQSEYARTLVGKKRERRAAKSERKNENRRRRLHCTHL
jgi:hypothetical protein